MKKHRNRVHTRTPRCPYCGSHSILRSADGIYLENPNHTQLYVCKNYPRCDAYVRVQPGTSLPLGSMANRELRAKRNEVHRYFSQFQKYGFMSREDSYQWLADILQVPLRMAHIGLLSDYSCDIVLAEAQKLLSWYQSKSISNPKISKGGTRVYDLNI